MFPVATLLRQYRPYGTFGILTLPSGLELATVERPWINNRQNVSCIPASEYKVDWMDRSASGKYKRIWHVQDVPDRSGILFHTANLVMELQGCIAMGIRHGRLGGQDAVLSSGAALNKMRAELAGKDFMLVII